MSKHDSDTLDAERLRYLWAPELDPLFWRRGRFGVVSAWYGHDNTEASPTPEKRIQFWSPEIAQPFCIQRIAVMFAHGLFVSLRVAPIGGKNRFKLHVCPIMLCHGFLRRGADGISWKCGWKRTLGLWYGSAVSKSAPHTRRTCLHSR